ncbi:hypothetical protein VPH35_003833 [Triticum aestivum]|uniref:Uncharacterized protein n=1 Tax=Triticum urartu TaxID=4572 RepID=A0A8R7K2L6_TRIUA
MCSPCSTASPLCSGASGFLLESIQCRISYCVSSFFHLWSIVCCCWFTCLEGSHAANLTLCCTRASRRLNSTVLLPWRSVLGQVMACYEI